MAVKVIWQTGVPEDLSFPEFLEVVRGINKRTNVSSRTFQIVITDAAKGDLGSTSLRGMVRSEDSGAADLAVWTFDFLG